MESIPHVLVFSRDEMLLHTRQLILEAFFHVEIAVKIQEAESMILQNKFDLIVLCHSLAPQELQRVYDLVDQQSPETKILMLAIPGSESNLPLSSQELVTEFGPYRLLKKTADMLGVDLKQSAPVLHLASL